MAGADRSSPLIFTTISSPWRGSLAQLLVLTPAGPTESGDDEDHRAAGVDVFVENTGQVRLIELAYKLTAPQGARFWWVCPHDQTSQFIPSLALRQSPDGLRRRHNAATSDIPATCVFTKRQTSIGRQITHRFPLDDINKRWTLCAAETRADVLSRLR